MDLLDHLMEIRQNGNQLSDAHLKEFIMNFLIAGRDTTACTMTFALLEVCRHPELVAKLRADADQAYQQHPDNTYAAVKAMKYTEAFVWEVLRHHTPVPQDSKFPIRD